MTRQTTPASEARWHWPAILLAAALVAFVVPMIFGGKPWDAKVSARMASERGGKLADLIQIYLWWASAINADALALLATVKRWSRPLPGREAPSRVGFIRSNERWFLSAVAACARAVLRCAGGRPRPSPPPSSSPGR